MMKRGRPVHPLGGTPRKDHLFDEHGRSYCGKWMYGGGREVTESDIDPEDDELCKTCTKSVLS